jgi:hypothetical protein
MLGMVMEMMEMQQLMMEVMPKHPWISVVVTRDHLGIAHDMDLGFRGEGDIGDSRSGSRHTTYPGSRPIGGGSLHPASNLVYDHSCVYR